jgi:hypothetical protein
MTDDSIKAKALALVNEVRAERGWEPLPILYRTNYEAEALCRAIEAHEAFKQEVSDAVTKAIGFCKDGRPASAAGAIGAFVIPKPKSDPLVEVMKELVLTARMTSGDLRAALEVRGLEIREKGQ